MTNLRTCPQCQAELSADAPEGVCPQCLLQMGLASAPAVTQPSPTSAGAAGFTPPTVAELAGAFPQLEILEFIGQGGMGAVYKARQASLDRIVALKILPPTAAADPAFAERFNREARALARLNHPHVVAVYDSGQAGGYFYLLMEYVDGANLRQLLRAGKLAPEEALAIVPQICEALQFAHDEGIVHRDIKPENVLIDKRGRVKVADFGLAKLLGRTATDYTLTGTHQIMGTPHYMAPEQWERPATVDHRADIYALGVVLYEMLTGELPLGRFDLPSHKVQLDVRLDQVVLRALAKEPDRRYQHASEVKTDMDNIGRAPPEPANPYTPPKPAADVSEAEIAAAAQKLHWPAVGLIVAGVLVMLLHLGLPLAVGIFMRGRGVFGLGLSEILVLAGSVFLSGLPMIFGGLAMYHRTSHTMAMIGAIFALLPCGTIVWVISLPFGIWALAVLAQAPVRAAFRYKDAELKAVKSAVAIDREAARRLVAGPAVGLIIVGVIDLIGLLLPVVVAVVFFFFVRLDAAPSNRPEALSPEVNTRAMNGSIPLISLTSVSLAAPATLPLLPLVMAQGGNAAPSVVPVYGPAVAIGLIILGSVPLAVLLIVAGLNLRHLRLYPLCVIGGIAAMLPCHVGFLIGLPIGIWTLVVLSRADVRAAF